MRTKMLITGVAALLCVAVVDARACSGCGCSAVKAEEAYTNVDTDGLKKLIESDEKVVLVDARSGKYDDGRRIADAKQLSEKSSEEDVIAVLPDKNAKIVAYCSSTKCPASAKLAHRLVDLGYKNVMKYPDGIAGWTKAGNEVSEPAKD